MNPLQSAYDLLSFSDSADRHATASSLTPLALKEFKAMWLKDHPRQSISEQELFDKAQRTMRAVELMYQPIPREKSEQLQQF